MVNEAGVERRRALRGDSRQSTGYSYRAIDEGAEEAIAAYPGLSLIVRAGAGYDTIDVDAASRRSVYVANCPGMNSVAVAELAFGLILSLDRRIPDNVADLREGRWNKGEYSKADGIYGKTLGIIGLGRIGRELAARARAFGMDVVAWSRSLSADNPDVAAREAAMAAAAAEGITPLDSPTAVAAAADVVSLHVASTPEDAGHCGHRLLCRHEAGRLLYQYLPGRDC